MKMLKDDVSTRLATQVLYLYHQPTPLQLRLMASRVLKPDSALARELPVKVLDPFGEPAYSWTRAAPNV